MCVCVYAYTERRERKRKREKEREHVEFLAKALHYNRACNSCNRAATELPKIEFLAMVSHKCIYRHIKVWRAEASPPSFFFDASLFAALPSADTLRPAPAVAVLLTASGSEDSQRGPYQQA